MAKPNTPSNPTKQIVMVIPQGDVTVALRYIVQRGTNRHVVGRGYCQKKYFEQVLGPVLVAGGIAVEYEGRTVALPLRDYIPHNT